VKYNAGVVLPSAIYTINSLATFLGAINEVGFATEDFKAAFAALELIEDGFIKESAIAWTEPLLSFLTEAVVYWRVNTVLRNEISDSLPRIAKGASRLAPLLAIRERAANSVTAYNSVRPRAWVAHHRNRPTHQ
jgi:hypothetical protein